MSVGKCGSGAFVLALAVGMASACSSGSSSSKSPSTTSATTKANFCSAEATINKASVSAHSPQDFLNVLKANGPAISTLDKDAPAGQVGSEARALVAAANKALAANSPDALDSVPHSYSGDIDSYCGIDGNGDPLPAYFAQGKGTPFCAAIDQINAGASNAQSASDILNFLKGHQQLLSQAGANDSNLPNPLKAEVQGLVSAAQKAVATDNADLLNSSAVQKGAMDASLYCGQDQ